jgi:hypothetical protein
MKNGTLSEESDKLSMTRWLLLDKKVRASRKFQTREEKAIMDRCRWFRLESETKIMPIYTQAFLSAFFAKRC